MFSGSYVCDPDRIYVLNMKILLMAVGRTTSEIMRRGIDLYKDRLKYYDAPVEIKIIEDIKGAKSLTQQRQKELEGESILRNVTPSDRVVLLDENGREFTSREFAAFVDKQMVSGVKRLVFVVGGPYGFSDAVYARADSKLSLSRMTFNHEMVRLFFIEQLYRAMTIRRGEPYHHD
ncbi:ribosomal RNA large subunit methyltransferase H [Muribaculaceae bacterium]|nr:ribosomal RNA large subunit methyltransferase H [Muribaculaceae bacterium]